MEKDDDKLVRFDWAAKRMLRDKANFVVLEGLISVLTGQNVKIQEILESEGNQDCDTDKFNRVDIKAKNASGEIIIVEIQLSRQVHYLERVLFGVGKSVIEHIGKGENYEKVKKVYSISLVYFNIGNGDDYAYKGQTTFIGMHSGREFQLDERERTGLNIRSPKDIFPEYYLICVNQFDKVALTPLEEWVDFLKNERIKPGTTTPGLREAAERLRYLKMSAEEKRSYDRYLDNLVNEAECIDTARLEGRAEGLAEGLAEGMTKGKAEGLAEGMTKGKAEGLAEGMTKGKAEGLAQKEEAIVMNMAKMGLCEAQIAAFTAIRPERIRQILAKP